MTRAIQGSTVRRYSVGDVATVAALVLSVASVLYLLIAPAYSGISTYQDTDGVTRMTTTSMSLLEANGWRLLIPVLVPVAICAFAVLARKSDQARGFRVTATVLLWAFVVLTGFSIGMLYLPSALAMTVASLYR